MVQDYGHVGRDDVQSGRCLPKLVGLILRHHIPPKRRYLCTKLHVVTINMTIIFTFITVKTSKLTQCLYHSQLGTIKVITLISAKSRSATHGHTPSKFSYLNVSYQAQRFVLCMDPFKNRWKTVHPNMHFETWFPPPRKQHYYETQSQMFRPAATVCCLVWFGSGKPNSRT